MSLPPPDAASARPNAGRWIPWLLLAIGVAVALAWLWRSGVLGPAKPAADASLSLESLDTRLLKAEAGTANLRRAQEALNQRLTDTSARTGLLRDEVLGITQRSALLEDSVRELANNRREAVAALRMDEAELLLTVAQQRLQLAGDVAGAIRATALAEGVLSSVRDPALLNLQQSLVQELAAMRAMPPDPARVAAGELDALEAAMPQLAAAGAPRVSEPAPPREGSGFDRLLHALVQVRPSGEQVLLTPADRATGESALALELALARTALERRDAPAFRASLGRIDGWLRRLYADGPLLRERRARLRALAPRPLALPVPVAGSTLEQLHALQRSRHESP